MANPERTQIDDEAQVDQAAEQVQEHAADYAADHAADHEPADGRPAVHRTRRRHEQPWPAVAREVDQAEDTLG